MPKKINSQEKAYSCFEKLDWIQIKKDFEGKNKSVVLFKLKKILKELWGKTDDTFLKETINSNFERFGLFLTTGL